MDGTLPTSIGNFGKIARLGFVACNITGTIPETISGLTSLEWLHFEENSLSGTIPSGFGRLMSLEKINLHKNLLSGRKRHSVLFLNRNQIAIDSRCSLYSKFNF